MASESWVELPQEIKDTAHELQTVHEAIELYLQALYQKFHSKKGRRHRTRSLEMFLQYLIAQGHSLAVTDLTLADGQGFLDSLTNHIDGTPLTSSQKKRYRSTLRSFSCFVHDLGLMEENVFLLVTIEH